MIFKKKSSEMTSLPNGKMEERPSLSSRLLHGRGSRDGRLMIAALGRNPTSDTLPLMGRDPCKFARKKPPLIQKFFRGLVFGSIADKIECKEDVCTLSDSEEDPDEKFNRLFKGPRQGVRLYERSRTISSKKTLLSIRDSGESQDKYVDGNAYKDLPISRPILSRRYSHDELISTRREYLIDVPSTLETLISQEDTDGDFRITVLDKGPKCFLLGSASSNGYNKYEIRGTYNISNLLQELALASELKLHAIILSQDRLNENPLVRLNRVIRDVFWGNLTRCIDASGIETISKDSKFPEATPTIYVPYADDQGFEYYTQISRSIPNLRLQVTRLPKVITPEFIRDINEYPGILSLSIKAERDPETGDITKKPCKYVVPGGRFNEMYGWDSYFIVLGLIEDGFVEEARDIVENMCYEIGYYGKILNANRSYYLGRTQPPLFTDMINRVAGALIADSDSIQEALCIVYRGYRAALKELFGVWFSSPRYTPSTGLSRYYAQGIGVPPETEPSHFLHLLEPHSRKHGMKFGEFVEKYTKGEFKNDELDEYFIHDRAVRESGHDTTYRLEGRCSNLNTIDLNSLLYKYERDIFRFITNDPRGYFKINIKRGENDEYFKSFMKFASDLAQYPLETLLTEKGGLETGWTDGVLIYDEKLDEINNDALSSFASLKSEEALPRVRSEEQSEFTLNEYKKILSLDNISTYKSNIPTEIIAPMWRTKSDVGEDNTTFEVHFYPALFEKLSNFTKKQVDKYLWNEEKGLYFDYNFDLGEQIEYETVTTFWPLWSNLASKNQADKMVPIALKKFEVTGGLVSGTEMGSCEALKMDKPSRQWDYPYGWCPHQVLAWIGLSDYGYEDDAKRLAYRWVYVITKSFFDFNGVVPEKYDVVNMTHIVNVEYGNVGSDFTYVVKEGFGWMNASFKVGLNFLSRHMRLCIGVLKHPDEYFYKKQIPHIPFCSRIAP